MEKLRETMKSQWIIGLVFHVAWMNLTTRLAIVSTALGRREALPPLQLRQSRTQVVTIAILTLYAGHRRSVVVYPSIAMPYLLLYCASLATTDCIKMANPLRPQEASRPPKGSQQSHQRDALCLFPVLFFLLLIDEHP